MLPNVSANDASGISQSESHAWDTLSLRVDLGGAMGIVGLIPTQPATTHTHNRLVVGCYVL